MNALDKKKRLLMIAGVIVVAGFLLLLRVVTWQKEFQKSPFSFFSQQDKAEFQKIWQKAQGLGSGLEKAIGNESSTDAEKIKETDIGAALSQDELEKLKSKIESEIK